MNFIQFLALSQLMNWSAGSQHKSPETFNVYNANETHAQKLIHLYQQAHSERMDIGRQSHMNQISKQLADSMVIPNKVTKFLAQYATAKLGSQFEKISINHGKLLNSLNEEWNRWAKQPGLLRDFQQKQLERIQPFIETLVIFKKVKDNVERSGFNGFKFNESHKKKYPFYLNEKG